MESLLSSGEDTDDDVEMEVDEQEEEDAESVQSDQSLSSVNDDEVIEAPLTATADEDKPAPSSWAAATPDVKTKMLEQYRVEHLLNKNKLSRASVRWHDTASDQQKFEFMELVLRGCPAWTVNDPNSVLVDKERGRRRAGAKMSAMIREIQTLV